MLKNNFININATFEETVILEGWIRNGSKIFTDEKTATSSIVYHYFTFSYQEIKYEFKLIENKNETEFKFSINQSVDILFNIKTKAECLFQNKSRIVHIWEEEDEDSY